jgi:hypothetical protein
MSIVERLEWTAADMTGNWDGELDSYADTVAEAATYITTLEAEKAALVVGLRSAPIPGRGEEMMAFRDRQDKWLRDVANPLLERTAHDR